MYTFTRPNKYVILLYCPWNRDSNKHCEIDSENTISSAAILEIGCAIAVGATIKWSDKYLQNLNCVLPPSEIR